jgi:hypothetical protein
MRVTAFQPEIPAPSEELDSFKLLQRAKQQLGRSWGMSEAHGHQFLVKGSRNTKVPLSEMSRVILDSAVDQPV